jgi:NADH-quinone oxidoreductase subunit G
MITIFIDNQSYQVKEGQNLLNACLTLGFDLPYFCWHPAMHSVGACRQCAVKQFQDAKDKRGKIIMSCMTLVTEGMRISIDDPEAKEFRASVIEWLMLNHPHDCPICDEGGECHLQDMTVMTEHAYRRTRFKKRTHRNQNLGPFINHEMNRCIACYRCVRFYRDYVGGQDFNVFASHDYVYFGRHEDGALESEFSGNLVEVCPTGVFTDKTLKRHYARKWDLQTAPSVCVHCGLGCNTIPGERYGDLRRIVNRYNHEVNGYFLCDRGRFGYEFVNSEKRIRTPLISPSLNPSRQGRENDALSPGGRGLGNGVQPIAKETALNRICGILSDSKNAVGIGSPRASLESNFALRSLVGKDNFYSGMSAQEHNLVSLIIDILQNGPARSPSLHDVEMADVVLILGEDVTNTAPMLDLALRQAARNKPKEMLARMNIPAWEDSAVRNAVQDDTGPLFIATTTSAKLDLIATGTYRAAPDDIARFGFAIAHELDPNSPTVTDIPLRTRVRAGVRGESDILLFIKEIAQALKTAKRPLVISGTSLGSEALIKAAANIAWALSTGEKSADLCYAVPECNSMGVGLIAGKNLREAFNTVYEGKADTVIILENDLFRRDDEKTVQDFISNAKHIIVIDHLINPTSSRAEIALPAGTFAESEGTFVNNEGRAQRFYKVFKSDENIQESWKWIHDIITISGRSKEAQWNNLDDMTAAMIAALPAFRSVQDIAPPASFRISGAKIPRQPHRYSGRTAILANIDVHEPKPAGDPDSALSFSMEGFDGQPPASLISRYWSPGWNSVQALNKFQQEVGGALDGGDPGKRLIDPTNNEPATYFKDIPKTFKRKDDEFLVVPLFHIYGSEELSMFSPSIAEIAPAQYLVMSPEDASRINAADADIIELTVAANKHQLEVRISSGLPVGIVGLITRLQKSVSFTPSLYGRIVKK